MNVLVDTSVWIDHFRRREPRLAELLAAGQVVGHSAVIGELACGTLRERERILQDLQRLPTLVHARVDEALLLLERHRLWGRGLGWTDVLLLASCRLGGAALWTRDRSLNAGAVELGVAYAVARPG